jgi:DNA repair protein RadD
MNLQVLRLHEFQGLLVISVYDAWGQHRCVMLWGATGIGKTEIAAYIARLAADHGGCTLFVVPLKTLAKQTKECFQNYGLPVGVIRGEDTHVSDHHAVIVGTIQTLASRWDRPEIKEHLDRVTLIVIDEAHRQYDWHPELLGRIPQAMVLGLSATPLREGLGRTYGALVRGPSYKWLIENKYLVPPRYFLPHIADVQAGLRSVGVAKTGDYVTRTYLKIA